MRLYVHFFGLFLLLLFISGIGIISHPARHGILQSQAQEDQHVTGGCGICARNVDSCRPKTHFSLLHLIKSTFFHHFSQLTSDIFLSKRSLSTPAPPRLQVAAEVAAAPAAQAAVEGDTGAAAPGTLEGPSTLMRCLAVRGPRGPQGAQGPMAGPRGTQVDILVLKDQKSRKGWKRMGLRKIHESM